MAAQGAQARSKHYVEAIGEVLARAEEDPPSPPDADAAAESELAHGDDAGRSRRHPCARTALIRAVAAAHGAHSPRFTKKLTTPGAVRPDAAARRAARLRNACLRYLTAADDENGAALADAHYRAATNMTDMIAGWRR
jgi:aminopeptidase N